MRNKVGSYNMRGLIELLQLCRSKTQNVLVKNAVFATSRPRIGDNNNGLSKMQLADRARFVHEDDAATSGTTGSDGIPTPARPPSPTRPPSPAGRVPWIKMVFGSVFSLLLAFWAPKWTTLLRIGGEAEVVLKEVEQTAEIVEKVATVVEKLSEDVANHLPDDNKFKKTVLVVEHISQEAAKDAYIAENLIHKVEVVKQDLEDVGETVEPINEKIVRDVKSSEGVSNNNL
ncbi:uncharacterized protein LOC104903797 [Beta vulgaris subsp. vulgaris]|uniref:uncharacterized protein LOC104903797 n=1 Tax=Beta vulgaris subsp. vulgaris TaxID=3555 RepID=UPI00203686F3|nr:uncharacterized protein LOC104903797 [Beta vulgaris subsp. vulgaris]